MNYSSFLPFFFVFFFFQNGESHNHQSLIENDTALAAEYFQQALVLEDSTLIDSAIQLNLKAVEVLRKHGALSSIEILARRFTYEEHLFESYKKIEDYEKAAPLIEEMLNVYKDSSYLSVIYVGKCHVNQYNQKFSEALTFCEQAEQIDKRLGERAATFIELGEVHLVLGNFAISQKYHEKAIPLLEKNKNVSHETLAGLYINTGVSFGYDGFYQQAAKYYQKAYEYIREKMGEEHPYLTICLLNFGAVEEKLGNYYKALEYYQASNLLSKSIDGERNPYLAYTLNNMGIIYELLGDNEQAEAAILEAISIINEKTPNNLEDKVSYNLNLGTLYVKLGKYEAAVNLLEANLDTTINILGESHPNIGITMSTLGGCYEDLGQLQKAETYYLNAVSFFEKHHQNTYPELSTTLNNLGAVQFELGKKEAALQTFQQSLWIHDKSCDKVDLFQNPQNLDVLEPLILLKTLDKKADYLYRLYQEDNNQFSWLELSYQTYLITLALQKQIIKSFDREASKLNLLQLVQEINSRAVAVCSDYLKYNNQLAEKEQLFGFIENSRASVLQEALFIKKMKSESAIPDSIIHLGRELKLKIDELKYQRVEEGIVPLALDEINKELTKLNLTYDSLWQRVGVDFPDYLFALKAQKSVNLKEIQASLEAKETIIDYFLTDSILYTIIITNTSFDLVKQVLKTSLKQQIHNFCQSIYQYHLANEQTELTYEQHLTAFIENGHALYKVLIEPLGELSEKIIIIPDGEIGYLPFDILLTSIPKAADSFRAWDFLIKKHQTSYSYSAQLWLEMKSKEYKQGNLLAFAPTFHETQELYTNVDQMRRKGLGRLLYNEKEVALITATFGGTKLIAAQANINEFYKEAPNATILHFATHAKLNDEYMDYSWLALTPTNDTSMSDKIYVKDLYNMDLSTEMVVLSACETGIGELHAGEGIFSLARGFAYAGAKSIITSLWSVNDKSTFQLMDSFYKQLKLGLNKDAALRTTKLNYLNTVDNYHAHPFYWASFIGIGDMSPINPPSTSHLYPILTGVISLLSIFLIFYFRATLFKRFR